MSEVEELRTLILEYDPANSDWGFRKGVMLQVLDAAFSSKDRGAPAQGEPIAWRYRHNSFAEGDWILGSRKPVGTWDEIQPLYTPTHSGQKTTGICCYCDAALSCAACGMEQPDDPCTPSPGDTGIERSDNISRVAMLTAQNAELYRLVEKQAACLHIFVSQDVVPDEVVADAKSLSGSVASTEKPEPLYDPRQAQGYPSKDDPVEQSPPASETLLPLQYEDGPDYCTVKDARGRDFALTMQPDLMRAMERAYAGSGASTDRSVKR